MFLFTQHKHKIHPARAPIKYLTCFVIALEL